MEKKAPTIGKEFCKLINDNSEIIRIHFKNGEACTYNSKDIEVDDKIYIYAGWHQGFKREKLNYCFKTFEYSEIEFFSDIS